MPPEERPRDTQDAINVTVNREQTLQNKHSKFKDKQYNVNKKSTYTEKLTFASSEIGTQSLHSYHDDISPNIIATTTQYFK